MSANKELITRFYSAFKVLDYATMQKCYSDNPIFNDPVFGILQGEEVGAMWEMLCKNAKDFHLNFGDIELVDEEYATCKWDATYTFSRTGRKVENHIKAYLRIQNGKITEHTDFFKIWDWSKQAIGIAGTLFGWSGYFKNRIRISARKNLEKFMSKKESF
ncbi:MAG: hypothetical protein C5B52_14145 [Bacteroidetes bacterium]|nr:MAG: hypothetical protein C5B52_14145 [Bacteroidota bacterium]